MSSKRRQRRNACAGKVRHASQEFAQIAVKKTWPTDGRELNAYHCGHCGSWHVGHLLAKTKGTHPGVNERRW